MGSNHGKVAGDAPLKGTNPDVHYGRQNGSAHSRHGRTQSPPKLPLHDTANGTANQMKPPVSCKRQQSSVSGKRSMRLKQFFKLATELQHENPVPASDQMMLENGTLDYAEINKTAPAKDAESRDSGVVVTPEGTKRKKKSKKGRKRRLFDKLIPRETGEENRGFSHGRDSFSGQFSDDGVHSLLMEDIAPGTSTVEGGRNGTKIEKRPSKIVRERFDQRVMRKYEIKALIGKGSFSRVFRAQHRLSKQIYAIKLVPAENGRGPFENELGILSRVKHANIIRLHEVIRAQHRVYMIMEFANGGELYERIIARGKFTERQTARTMSMILLGLDYLHRMGITHRDLKPENLLYCGDPEDPETRLLITDFGLAHQQISSSQSELMTDTCGTPEYIAPEVLLRMSYSNKVDLWAVGVIAYILLSGIMPFDSESRTRLYRQIIRGKYYFYAEFWGNVSMEAKGFVAALLETEPEERLSAQESLCYPWLVANTESRRKSIYGNSNSLKRLPSPVSQTQSSTRRDRAGSMHSPKNADHSSSVQLRDHRGSAHRSRASSANNREHVTSVHLPEYQAEWSNTAERARRKSHHARPDPNPLPYSDARTQHHPHREHHYENEPPLNTSRASSVNENQFRNHRDHYPEYSHRDSLPRSLDLGSRPGSRMGGSRIVVGGGRLSAQPGVPNLAKEERYEDEGVGELERTRSTRSIRSVARSDHTHRVQIDEIERLSRDPEIRRLAYDRSSRSRSHASNPGHNVSVRQNGTHGSRPQNQHYHSEAKVFVEPKSSEKSRVTQKDYGIV